MNNKETSEKRKAKIHVLIVAAGSGERFSETKKPPKQYALIDKITVLEHSIKAFEGLECISGMTIVLNKDDKYWSKLKIKQNIPLNTAIGGNNRNQSVINGLNSMSLKNNDWVLIHDAARPCVRHKDIEKLIKNVTKVDMGGLLVKPIVDTIKFSEDLIHSSKTIDRDHLFAALTPQMFKYGQLLNILNKENDTNISDEASAFEQAGKRPTLVIGHNDNIKITHKEDLLLAEFNLRKQGRIQ